jgi:hypothetical protein
MKTVDFIRVLKYKVELSTIMSLYNKAKEAVVEWTVFTTLALISLLALVLWSAVPSTVWEGISNAVEKKVLWAIIGLLSLVIIGETAYLIRNYLKARTLLHFYGGALWNSNCELFCPKEETPLFQSGQTFNEFNPSEKELRFSNVQNVIVLVSLRIQVGVL